MKENCKVDKQTAEKMDITGKRLYAVKHVLELFIYCVEDKIYSKSSVEIYYLGLLLNEYFNNTKKMYNNIEEELGTLK